MRHCFLKLDRKGLKGPFTIQRCQIKEGNKKKFWNKILYTPQFSCMVFHAIIPKQKYGIPSNKIKIKKNVIYVPGKICRRKHYRLKICKDMETTKRMHVFRFRNWGNWQVRRVTDTKNLIYILCPGHEMPFFNIWSGLLVLICSLMPRLWWLLWANLVSDEEFTVNLLEMKEASFWADFITPLVYLIGLPHRSA